MRPLNIAHYPLSSKRSWPDLIGLYALFLLLILNPFHFVVREKFLYYREFFAVLFSILWFFKVMKRTDLYVRREVFYLVLFPLLLILFAIVDPGKNLYGSDYSVASMELETVNPGLYVLRNALLYIPMVLYFSVRGITEKEVRRIALITVAVGPFSVITFLNHSEIATVQTIGIVAQFGGRGLAYNSYIPYLTFPILSAMYLIVIRSNIVIKLVLTAVLIALSAYISFSTSRQSVLFVIICGLVFFLKSKEIRLWKKTVFICCILMLATFIFNNITAKYDLSDKFLDRFTSASGAIETKRFEKAKDGLELLQPYEYLIGAGLTSVIVSGPHNDYERWLQRIGIFAAAIGFLPFFIAARKVYARIRYSRFNALNIYVMLSIFFTLYHSFFGYPREDAFQAPYCFLGLAIWLGIQREKFANTQYSKRQACQTFQGAVAGKN